MRYLGLIGLALLFVYFYTQYEKALAVCYKFNKKLTRLIYAGAKEVSLRLAFDIKNETDFSVNIKSYDLKLMHEGKLLAIIKGNISQEIKRKSESVVRLDVSFSPAQIFADNKDRLIEIVQNIKEIKFVLFGTVKIDSKVIDANININETFTLNDFE